MGAKDRYMRGRKKNWHAWAFLMSDDRGGWSFCHWAEPFKPRDKKPSPEGKWVKVRFVEVR